MRTLQCLLLLLLLPFLSLAQVGVNTTTPNAALDVQSTSNGVLIPRVQLTNALDIATVVNPAGGALSTSTLIYNIAAAGLAPNDVVSGFYYWNGTRWMAMNGSVADHDWYEEGTTTAPDAITDDMFHTGKVAIGKNTANTTLDLETTNENVGIKNTLIKNSATGTNYNIDNDININSTDFSYGLRNHFFGTGTGDKVGVANLSDVGVLGGKTGVTNDFIGYNSDVIKGIASTMTHVGSGNSYGVFNTLDNLSGSSGLTYGVYNVFNNNSAGMAIGVNNEITAPSGNGGTFGVRNILSGGKSGGKIGISNTITSTISDSMTGISNNITSTVNGGSVTGIQNNLTANSDTLVSGNLNQLGGTGNSNINGVYSFITNSGNGDHTGILSNLSGTGTGRKYGTFTTIDPAAGGQHFGIFSRVLKAGANYAGYFNGKVAIGTNISAGIDDYVFPAARGTNDQIMQTDGSGNVTWRNPNFWSLNGNSGTSATTAFGNTFAATDNFMGTTDNVDLIFGTNNRPRMKISAYGHVGIGYNPTDAKLTVYSPLIMGYVNRHCLDIMQENNDYGSTLAIPASSTFSNWSSGTGSTRWTNMHLYSGSLGSLNNGTNVGLLVVAENAANNYAIIVPPSSGDVGYGTSNPTTKLHVVNPTAGALRIEDGTQANGNVFRSDANGLGTWQNPNTFSWSLAGNSVNAATQFLGSTNNADVVFKRSNVRAGAIAQFNTSLGVNAMVSVTSGTQNVAIGTNALDSNIISGGNTAVGYDALQSTTGDYNTAFGNSALFSFATGNSNCAFGYNALTGLTSGVNNIGIGTNAVVPSATGSNQIRMGNTAITYAGIQVAWTVTSDKRWKDNIQSSDLGLDFINHLNPVSYIRKNDAAKKTEYGFIAQELDKTLNEFGATNNGIITKDDAGMLGVRYNDLLAPIVKAIQELKAENDVLKAENASLNNRLKALENK